MILQKESCITALDIVSLFKGGVVGSVIDPRIIFQYALKANAAQIILAHNHPSGNTKPSDADLSITKKINEGAKHLDISVLDHIILTGNEEYYRFAEEGDLLRKYFLIFLIFINYCSNFIEGFAHFESLAQSVLHTAYNLRTISFNIYTPLLS